MKAPSCVVPAAENRRKWMVSGFGLALLAVVTLLPAVALAQDVPGQQLLQFARNFIIAPIALFAIVVACVAAFIRPEAVRSAGYIAVIAVLLFFLLANSDRLLQAMRAG